MLPERSEFRRAATTPSRLQQRTVLGAQLASCMFLQYQYSNFFSLRLPFSFPILFLVHAVFLIGLVSSCLKFFTCSTSGFVFALVYPSSIPLVGYADSECLFLPCFTCDLTRYSTVRL